MAVDGQAFHLQWGGTFEAPVCTDVISIVLEEGLAFLQFRTLENSLVRVPIPASALVGLADVALAAHDRLERE